MKKTATEKKNNKTKTSIMYEIRPIRFLPVFVMNTKRQRGLDMCATDSKKPPLFSQASLTKIQRIWAMIGKTFRGHPWWSKWGATRETSQVLTYGLYFPSSPREDSPPQLPLLSTLPLPSVGSNPVLTMSRIQSFPEVLSQHPTAELRAGHREPFKPAQPQWTWGKAPGRSHLLVWLAGLPVETLIGQWVLPLLNVKVCFLSKAGPFPDLWSPFQLISIRAFPGGRIHHSSSGYSAASSSPLWAMILTSDLAWTFLIALAYFFLKSRWVAWIAHYSSCIVGINLTQEWKGGQAINIKKEF